MKRLLDTLYARLVLLLFGILLVAQLLSALLHLGERWEVLKYAAGYNTGLRIAGMTHLLDALSPAQRADAVAALDLPPLRVRLAERPQDSVDEAGPHAEMFRRMLGMHLGVGRDFRVAIDDRADPFERGPGWGAPGAGMMGRHMGGWMRGPGFAYVVQVRLKDGAWAVFDYRLPEELSDWPVNLLFALGLLLLSVLVAALLAVRWLVRPLRRLSEAAEALGRDIDHPPLAEDGPAEVRHALHAFNTMQGRIARFIAERTRILAAVSHDLKTPITRLRLRVEGIEDPVLRERMGHDLDEMQALVGAALEFMRGAAITETHVPLGLGDLLDGLRADAEDSGHQVEVRCGITRPYPAKPVALRRCLTNLIENAARYAGAVEIEAAEGTNEVVIRVLDRGPGIPDADKERVLEPFQRLDGARSPGSGGVGLGLNIARNIARAHGGDLELHDRPGGGLEVRVTLPR